MPGVKVFAQSIRRRRSPPSASPSLVPPGGRACKSDQRPHRPRYGGMCVRSRAGAPTLTSDTAAPPDPAVHAAPVFQRRCKSYFFLAAGVRLVASIHWMQPHGEAAGSSSTVKPATL
eukprot:2760622-Prymnesium_polylepis.2